MSGKRYILEGAAQKIGLLRWKTENIFEHSRNNKKIVVDCKLPERRTLFQCQNDEKC